VLISLRVEVKGGGVSHITAGFIGNDGNVIANLILVRIAFEGIKRITYRHVRRPCRAGIGAKGIK
jgi:hypothetical protein